MKIDLQKISTLRDGGTSVWINPDVKNNIKSREDANNAQQYYMDGRIRTTTPGELYDKYPSDKDAKIVDKNLFNFLNL